MLITKGYMTAEEVFWSCPVEIKPYEELYRLQEQKADEQAWLQGMYMLRAISACFSKDAKYPDKPITIEKGYGLSEEEKKQRDIDMFVAQMQTMSANWQATHRNKQTEIE